MESGSDELSAQEKADRAEIEKVWKKYWRTLEKVTTYPKADRERVFGEVMVDPALGAALENAQTYDKQNVAPYGSVKHELRWGPAVDGKDEAAMADCQDQSHYGLADLDRKVTMDRGPKRANVHGTFTRTEAGWKVLAWVLMDTKC